MINFGRFRPLSESGFRLIRALILLIVSLKLNFDEICVSFEEGKRL